MSEQRRFSPLDIERVKNPKNVFIQNATEAIARYRQLRDGLPEVTELDMLTTLLTGWKDNPDQFDSNISEREDALNGKFKRIHRLRVKREGEVSELSTDSANPDTILNLYVKIFSGDTQKMQCLFRLLNEVTNPAELLLEGMNGMESVFLNVSTSLAYMDTASRRQVNTPLSGVSYQWTNESNDAIAIGTRKIGEGFVKTRLNLSVPKAVFAKMQVAAMGL